MAKPLDLDAYLGRMNYTGPPHSDLRRPHWHPPSPYREHSLRKLRRRNSAARSGSTRKDCKPRSSPPAEEATASNTQVSCTPLFERIGFAPVRHASRVLLFEPRHESVRQHMFVTVTIGGTTYVIDPGFGPFACSVPIPIDGTPVPTGAPTHRLVREGNDWVLYVTREGEQIQGWVSTMEEEYPVDFEMMNYYMATHPASFFTHNILASAVTPEGRVNIMNQGVHIIRNGAAEPAQLADRKALRTLIAQHFGFDLPELETMKVDAVPDWQ